MADVNLYKKTSAPATANPNDIIFVKSGSLVSMYICDTEGTPYGVIPSGDYVSKVNSASGNVQLDLSFSGGVLSLTGSSATQNLDARYFQTTGTLPFSQLSGVPTTVSGYGITDAYTKSQVDAITGALSNLQTTTQTNLVAAINELVTAINNGMRTPQPIDCSANPNYPASQAGDTYKVTVAGKIGGASGQVVQVNDQIICTATNGGGDQATVGASFFIIQGNVDSATTSVQGLGRIATQAEVNAGTEDKAWVTPVTLATLLDANYYTAAEVNAKGYLTAEADTLATVTGRGSTTSIPSSINGVYIGSTPLSSGQYGGVSINLGTGVSVAKAFRLVGNDGATTPVYYAAENGILVGANTPTYAYWGIAPSGGENSQYATGKSLRLYPDGSLYYGTPPANASAATKFLGLSSDGHTISTRTAAQVLSDIGGFSPLTSTVDWNSVTGNLSFINTSGLHSPDGSSTYTGLYAAASVNQGFTIASRNNDLWFRDLNAGTWGSWYKVLTTDALASVETDPVWTAAKSVATNIPGLWTFTNGLNAYKFVNIGSAAGNEGFYASPYAYFGMKLGSGTPLIAYNVEPTNGSDSWEQHTSAAGSSAISLTNDGKLLLYSAPIGQTAGTFASFWGTAKTVATQDWVASQIPAIPNLEQVTTQGGTTDKPISIINTGIGLTINGGVAVPNAIQFGSAGGNGTGGYIQGIQNTAPGYGIWTGSNAYYDGANWIQPRGTSVGSHIFGVTHHKEFIWQYAAPNGTNGATITPTELMALNSVGTLTISGTAILNGVGDASSSNIKVAVLDTNNIIRYRTTAELLTDIGAQPTGTYLTSVPTLQQVTDAGAITNDIINMGNALVINGAAGSYREVMFKTGANYRWGVMVTNSAESGSNAGSDFAIYRYADDGSAAGNVLTINRATGVSTFPGSVMVGSIAKSGGTSTQFLKADGSVDTNTYLTSFTETDPIFTASAAADIEASDITNWNAAYAAKHDALTLGTNKNGLSLATQVLSLAIASTSAAGAMSATDKSKLDGIATNANNYTLPTATSSVLGGVKIGANINIASGVISVPSVTTSAAGVMSSADKTKLDGIASGANNYSLPIATASVLGGIKVGSGLSVDANGVLSNPNGTAYTLPTATSTVLGGIKVGSTLNIASGVLNGNKATNVALGMVMAGDNMAVDANGAITMQWAAVEW